MGWPYPFVWVGLLVTVALVGFPFAVLIFVFVFTTIKAGRSHLRNAVLGLAAMAFLSLMSHFLTLQYPPGLLQQFVEMPWWLGG